MKTSIRVIRFRRKRDQKTNYKRRIGLLKSETPRLVIRRSLKNMLAQVVGYEAIGDKVLVSAHSSDLKKLGWDVNKNNTPASYLVGYLLGKKALKAKIKGAIFDIGLQESIKGSSIYACLKGVIDSGLKVPASEDIFPSKERIEGTHINDKVVQKFKDLKKKIEQSS